MRKTNIQDIIIYIEDNITHEISLNDIAKIVNYSPYYCSACFRNYIGTSIKSYILKRRLQRAAEDLCLNQLRVIDIAYKYCYSSQEAFSRAFLGSYGISPYEYRKKQLPISKYYAKNSSNCGNNKDGCSMKNEVIYNIQEEISEKYQANVLHILNGSCMMDEFEKNRWVNEKFTYIPFNEAMCWGEADEEIFSDSFIEKRVQSLNTTIEQYRSIVLNPLEPLLKNRFDTIVLWFGDDMFCQINMLTILGYLEQCNFEGDVLFCMTNEITDEMLPDAYEVDIKGSLQKYKSIVCKKEMTTEKLMPVMYQAVSLYLNYRSKNSEINRYIMKNISKENSELVVDLLKTFPQYGLGDLQYEMLIKNLRIDSCTLE
ncbi:helix-turn-helix transcriptional regulator [Clostridium sp. YIM B02515]|uniref:Helix-turn-helix transcriptional regulator n=1 Tax=Clostridium rhizosphaerae TaxID=2803861 RepID=A0ABS1T5H7_9CLOT|nr:AraC family transcriptional regulator [Clostridium rhizosphaerae]MBL4934511.1 helix-turn-helix transcriptional regulator [Clostridium rhizosphaerae]